MTQKAFSLVASNKYLDLFSEFISKAMKNYGYKEHMEMKRPDNPQIWQFRKEDSIIAMSIDPSKSTLAAESEITVEAETEKGMEEVYKIVGNAIALMMTEYSQKLFEAIESKKARLTILSAINKRLDDLKKEI